jgi:pilus assembly protein CpaC
MPDNSKNRNPFRASWLAVPACVVMLCASAAWGQSAIATNPSAMMQAVKPLAAAISAASKPAALLPQQSSEVPETLHLLVGRSLVITSPTRIKRISIADTSIADATAVTPNQVLVNGKAPGGVSLLIWDINDQSQSFEVSVDIDTLSLSQKIHEVFPNEPVQIETSKDVVMLSGKISSAAVANKILEVVKNATPKVTSLMEVPAVPAGQILLEVKFAEVDRTALTQLGFNLILPGGNVLGAVGTQQFGAVSLSTPIPAVPTTTSTATSTVSTPGTTQFTLSSLLNIFLYDPKLNLGATIQALQQKDVLQILAEPNLLTASGKEASFLAGGEFPFPVVQSAAGGGLPTITIQFKEFGVRLTFIPTIMEDGMIHLKVAPEVSALDYANSLTISGFTIPALSSRKISSEMDLKDGQTFAIAGLVDNRTTEIMSKIPGIGDLPVIGKLFQSKSVNKSRNELLVIVTPRIVHPLNPDNKPAGPVFIEPFLPAASSPSYQPSGSK